MTVRYLGLTEANFVTQLELDADTEGISSINPTIDLTKNPEVIKCSVTRALFCEIQQGP